MIQSMFRYVCERHVCRMKFTVLPRVRRRVVRSITINSINRGVEYLSISPNPPRLSTQFIKDRKSGVASGARISTRFYDLVRQYLRRFLPVIYLQRSPWNHSPVYVRGEATTVGPLFDRRIPRSFAACH